MKKIIYILIPFFTPAISYAQSTPQNLNDIVGLGVVILETIIPILIGLAVLMFIWGIFRYYVSDNANTKKEAVKIIGYGVVSIFVMVSLWGLVNFLAYSLNLDINAGNPNGILETKPINIKSINL